MEEKGAAGSDPRAARGRPASPAPGAGLRARGSRGGGRRVAGEGARLSGIVKAEVCKRQEAGDAKGRDTRCAEGGIAVVVDGGRAR